MDKLHQAKSITDTNLKRAVGTCAVRDQICAQFPEFPRKIVNAKIRQAVRKGILSGCASDNCARRGLCMNPSACDGAYRVVAE